MSMAPRISVCVPTFNRSQYLADCLESILQQSFSDFEVLVVDNASTDETPKVVGKVSDPRLKYKRNNTNMGQVANLNECLRLASGEFVCIFHDDDVYDPRILEREIDVLLRHDQVGLVHTAVWLLTEQGIVRKLHQVSKHDYVRAGQDVLLDYLQHGQDIVFSTVMVRRSCYEKVEKFDARYLCADFDMWLRIALNFDIAYIAEPLAGYRIHTKSESQGMQPSGWVREYFEIFDKAVGMARTKIPWIVQAEPELRAAARRSQGQRSRMAAAASIARGNYDLATKYLDVASELDPSIRGTVTDTLLHTLRNPPGRIVLQVLQRFQHRAHCVWIGGGKRIGTEMLSRGVD